jgi:PmbA protein
MDTLKENFQEITAQAKQDGVKVEMLVAGGESLELGFQQLKLSKFESTQSQTAGLRVLLGAAQGYASTENLSLEALLRTYKEALNNARTVASADSFEIPMVKPQPYQKMDTLCTTEEIAMERKMEIAKGLEEKCLKLDSRVQVVPYSGFSESTSFWRVLNSEGVDQEFKQRYYAGNATPLAKEGENSKMGGEGFFARNFDQINVDEVTQESVTNAVKYLGATKLKTGVYPVVLDRKVMPKLLSMLIAYLSAKEVYEGKSLLQNKLGQQVASEKFQLVDDPFEMRGAGVRPFDAEGAPSQKTVLFENGVLKNFLTNLEYAKRMNLPHTANAARGPSSPMDIAPTNLVVAKGTKTLEQLLAHNPGKTVHITKFTGGLHAGFKQSTGDLSMPAEGFLYEDGKCLGAVDQFVVSGNVLDVLRDIVELGDSYRKPGSSLIAPDVLIKSMSVAGG